MNKIVLMIILPISIILFAGELKEITKACNSNDFSSCSKLAHMYDSGTNGVKVDHLKATELFRKACNGGNGEGCYYLSFKYSNGSLPSNIEMNTDMANALDSKANKIWKMKCSEGSAEDCGWLGSSYSMKAFFDEANEASHSAKAIKYLKKACEGKYSKSCLVLGNLFMNGATVIYNYKIAKNYYKKACDFANQEGCKYYEDKKNKCDILAANPKDITTPPGIKGVEFENIVSKQAIKACKKAVEDFPLIARYNYQLALAYFADSNRDEGMKYMQTSAYQGHILSLHFMALYLDSVAPEKNYKKAFDYYLQAAKKGYIPSQVKLGVIYDKEAEVYGVENNKKKSFQWFLSAARGGQVLAQKRVAHMYIAGYGTNKNYKKSLYWFKKAAEQGDLFSQIYLAGEYYLGKRIEKNGKKFLYWITKAAKQGDISAQRRLAFQYYWGGFIEKNDKKSFEWFMKAAVQGDKESQRRLAHAYREGKGVQQNFKKAFEWYMKAAMQGDKSSFSSLSMMYYDGKGVRRNYIKAYAWMSLALASTTNLKLREGYERLLNMYQKRMTSHQIFLAQEYNPLIENRQREKERQISPPNIYTGTGFFIKDNIIVTNQHVVKKCKFIEITSGLQKINAELLISDTKNDLAILKIKKSNNSFLEFRAKNTARIGEKIIVLGYPFGKLLGSEVKVTTGNISSLNGLLDDITSMQITAPVQPGNSGGPLLDESGNIVGIVVARLEKDLSGNIAQNVNIAIKPNVLQILLAMHNIDYKVSLSEETKRVVDIVENAKKSITQVICHE